MTRTAQSDMELARAQSTGVGPVSIIYRALRDHIEVTAEQLEWNSLELRKLHKIMDSLRIRADGVLEARLAPHNKPRWCAICPPSFRGKHMH